MESTTGTLIGAIGMGLLAIPWFARKGPTLRMAQIGWVCVGLYFFNQSWVYLTHDDVILTVMCALTLPLSVAMAWWEEKASEQQKSAVYQYAKLLYLLL